MDRRHRPVALLLTLAVCAAAPTRAATPAAASGQSVAPGRSGALIRAVHALGSLWLLDDNGWLRQLPDAAAAAIGIAAEHRAFDLCRIDGAPVIAARSDTGVAVRRWTAAGWQMLGIVTLTAEERPIGLACGGATPVLLTDRGITALGQPTRALQGSVPRGFRHVLFLDGDTLLVGSNAGEWGGGLVRIALATGAVTAIADAGAPVQDIAVRPGKPGCVVAAIGLVHVFPSGRLTEICGNAARRLFAAPYGDMPPAKPRTPGADPCPAVAFFALARDAGGLTAIGVDGMRAIRATGVGAARPLPAATERGGEFIVAASPDYWLVMTGINARGSIGGAMPLVVPR